MTIECYVSKCPYHSENYNPGNGPFCDEHECRFPPVEPEPVGKVSFAIDCKHTVPVVDRRSSEALRTALNYAKRIAGHDRVGGFMLAIAYRATNRVMLRVVGGLNG